MVGFRHVCVWWCGYGGCEEWVWWVLGIMCGYEVCIYGGCEVCGGFQVCVCV